MKIFYKLVLMGLLLIPTISKAVYIVNEPISLTQPNGVIINCFVTGDEYYNWVHDADNYTIIQNKDNGYYVYANLVNDELVATQYIVGTSNPKLLNLKKGLNIPPSKMIQYRQSKLNQIPPKPIININKSMNVQYAAPSGILNNVVIFIRFSGESEYTDQTTIYSDMFNTTTAGYNSMRNYFDEVSYNNLTINSTFYPIPSGSTVISYQDSYTRQYYQPYNATTNPIGYNNSSESESREHTLLKNAVDAVSSQISPSLNIDNDNDGYVDNVCFIIDGSSGAWSDLLWPHMWALYSQTALINGKRVWDYNFQLQNFTISSGVGVLCHEMFHTLGAPDLYHYSQDGKDPVGKWDIMKQTMNPPEHMGAYMKYRYGNWISSIPQITTSGTYTLNPLTSSTNNCYKIASPNSYTEFFVLEYRKKTGTFESSIPGSGLIIYRVNTSEDGNGNMNGPPDEIYIYRLNGDTANNGYIDSAFFSSDANRTKFNDLSNPACFLSNGISGGLNISNITSAGSTISFTYVASSIPANSISASLFSVCTGSSSTLSLNGGSLGSNANWYWYSGTCGSNYISSGISAIISPTIETTYFVRAEGSTNTTSCVSIIISIGNNISLLESFESFTFPPSGWTTANLALGSDWVQKAAGSTLPNWGSNLPASPIGGGNNYAVADYDPNLQGNDQWLITPAININSGDSLKFNLMMYNVYYYDNLEVLVSTTNNSTASFTSTLITVNETDFTDTIWTPFSFDLSSYAGQTIYIAFREFYTGESGGSCFGLDLISIGKSCTSQSTIPSSIVANPISICTGSSSTLGITDGVLITGDNWNWYSSSCGGAYITSGISTIVSPTITTIYYVRAEGISNTTSCISTTVIVSTLSTIPILAYASPSIVCSGFTSSLKIYGGNIGAGSSWKWYSGSCGGTSIGTGSPLAVNPTVATTYYVRAEGACNTTACKNKTVTLYNSSVTPTSLSASNSSINVGSLSTITVNGGSLGYLANWKWFINSCGGTNAGAGASLTVSPTISTTYYVRAQGSCNTTTCVSTTISINSISIAPNSTSANPSSICIGSSSTLNVIGGSLGEGADWYWYVYSCGGTSVGVGSSITVNPTSSTIYYVRAEGTYNNTNCIARPVSIYASSIAPTSASANPNEICQGSTTTLTINGGSLGKSAYWRWNTGSCNGTYTGLNASIVKNPTITTTYWVKATGTCNTTNCVSVTVTVNAESIAPMSISATPISVNLGSSSTLNVVSGSLGYGGDWIWYQNTCGGTSIGNGSPITFSPTTSTSYFVRAEGNCNTTFCKNIIINVNKGDEFDNNNISYFNNTDALTNDIFIYPNPANIFINIKYNIASESNVNIELYNIIGTKVINIVNEIQLMGEYNKEINLSSLPSGIYFCKMILDNNNVIVKKVIISK